MRPHPSVLEFASLLLVLGGCTCGEPAAEPQPPPQAPAPPPQLTLTAYQLDNGLDVELLTGPCGDAAGAALVFDVGVDHDPPGRSGMMLVLERLLASRMEGAQVHVGPDHTSIALSRPSAEVDAALGALASSMGAGALDDAALARARDAVLRDLARMRGGDAARTALAFAAESVRGTRGDGWRGGVAEELAAIELSELRAFADAHLRAGQARLVVASAGEVSALRAAVASSFGASVAGEAPTAREPSDARVMGTLVFGDAPAALALALPAPPADDPLYPAFLVLASRVLAASADASWDASFDPLLEPEGVLISAPLVAGETPEAAAEALRRELTQLADAAISEADLAAAAERFSALLGEQELSPSACERDPRALALARARRRQLAVDALPLSERLAQTTQAQLSEASAVIGARRSAAIAAGGTIR